MSTERLGIWRGAVAACAVACGAVWMSAPPAPLGQPPVEVQRKSEGCTSCHTATDAPTMHRSEVVALGCTDCHGGAPDVRLPDGVEPGDEVYARTQKAAHVPARFPERWTSSANPERTYTLLNEESRDFVRFINPGDYRVAREACGACHLPIIEAAERSLMSTGAMLWGGASYNNGILPYKNYLLGEAYDKNGRAASLEALPFLEPDPNALSSLVPLPHWEVVPSGDPFRAFEPGAWSGSTRYAEIGQPNMSVEPGSPELRVSPRGPGTGANVSIPVMNIHKTRLNDPFSWFLGTNDQPGDYRSSGCSACHVVYANDRTPRHSGPWSKHGHLGQTNNPDPTIPRGESGHPIEHAFTRAIPTSQCMVCHMHQPNVFVNSYLGFTMWDYEADAPAMWPAEQRDPTHAQAQAAWERNPEGAVARGRWTDPDFLAGVSELNPTLKDTQFADYHGHGWNFRGIFKRDRKGNLLDAQERIVAPDDPAKWDKAVHLMSGHAEAGMHCVDCHFANDAHGNGHIYGEVAAAIEIGCKDCHGTASALPTLRTSGPASGAGSDLSSHRVQDGRARFDWRGGELFQRSALDPELEWKVPLVRHSVDPTHTAFNPRSAEAKLQVRGGGTTTYESLDGSALAHRDEEMTCFTCHLSWTTSCAGCHLPTEATIRGEAHHYEGGISQGLATYNPQVVREDMFLLGRHGVARGGVIAPLRSSSALVVSSTNARGERIYQQQPPVSSAGYSSQAFNPHYSHTERREETKGCEDCHVSANDDNNAIMAQLLALGTQFVSFVGHHAWVGTEDSVEAVVVTEWPEPQAVIGSYLQRYAYPSNFAEHQGRDLRLPEVRQRLTGAVGCLQMRGEFLYVAEAGRGLQVYDIARIGHKGVTQPITRGEWATGIRLDVPTPAPTCVALPTNQPIRPALNRREIILVDNLEQPMHPIYSYAVLTDAELGLVLVNVETLGDGNSADDRLVAAAIWDGDGALVGARHVTLAGHVAWVSTPEAVVAVDLDDPLEPRLISRVPLPDPRATALQFRYLWVTTARGLETIEVTWPERPVHLPAATIPLGEARGLHVARTYVYVAAGADGLVIVDVERPPQPRVYTRFDGGGRLTDVRDVTVGSTNASLFAYLAAGEAGLAVVQLTAPDTQPNFYGFSPEPVPQLIAWKETRGPATAVSRGLERDRAVDETGHQVAVFGRLGARPFTLEEMRRLYLDGEGELYRVLNVEHRVRAGVPRRP